MWGGFVWAWRKIWSQHLQLQWSSLLQPPHLFPNQGGASHTWFNFGLWLVSFHSVCTCMVLILLKIHLLWSWRGCDVGAEQHQYVCLLSSSNRESFWCLVLTVTGCTSFWNVYLSYSEFTWAGPCPQLSLIWSGSIRNLSKIFREVGLGSSWQNTMATRTIIFHICSKYHPTVRHF